MSLTNMYKFEYVRASMLLPETKKELSDFYSNHYGYWSNDSKFKGRRVTLSISRLEEWLNDSSELYTARLKSDNSLIGYAIATRGTTSDKEEKVIWVTQFVVHSDYRNEGIGKELLFFIWGLSSYFSWGLVTANPYAIRALEKATRRRCHPIRIKKNMVKLLNFGDKYVSYIKKESIEKEIDDVISIVNTNFPVDHSEVPNMLSNITSEEKPWLLGDLKEGWEWFAFTFNDQDQIELTQEEIEAMLTASDEIAKEAYSRMLMDRQSHKWASHTDIEVDYIVEKCKLSEKSSILDIGCGMGRHTLKLIEKGYNTVGVDYVPELISLASRKIENSKHDIFQVVDFSSTVIPFAPESFDTVLCLYDVIGSYVEESKNRNILANMFNILKKGGYALISVLNLHLTEAIAENKFILSESSIPLLNLESSNTMEMNGNIFDPKYFLLDEKSKIVYRKEVFSCDNSFPKELIVRDKRFYSEEIVKLCTDIGFRVINLSFVKAGWGSTYNSQDKAAKEILILLQK